MPPPPRGSMGSGTLQHLTLELKKCLRLKSWMKKTPVWAALGDSRNKELLNRKRPQTEPDQAYLVVLHRVYVISFSTNALILTSPCFPQPTLKSCPPHPPHLMKVLKAALWGLMHSGTRLPCWCSVMKRWINSEDRNGIISRNQSQTSQRKLTAVTSSYGGQTAKIVIYKKNKTKTPQYTTHTTKNNKISKLNTVL